MMLICLSQSVKNMTLDKEQQTLVEQNHNLIYGYAKIKNLDIEDYYGILAIGLCKAAGAYRQEKGEFSTFAYQCMNNELNDYYKSNRKAIPSELVISLYASKEVDDDSSIVYIDMIEDNSSPYDNSLLDIQYSNMLKKLKSPEKEIVEYLKDGMTLESIAEKLGCTKSRVCQIRQKLKKQWSKYFK